MTGWLSAIGDVRTGVSEGIGSSAGAVVGEAREVAAVDQPELLLDGALARVSVGTEPGVVSDRVPPNALNVIVRLAGVFLGVTTRGHAEYLLDIRATRVGFPLTVDARDGEVARELNSSNILNSGAEVLGGTVGIDVGEQVRWLDGVGSSARSSKVVRSRD